MALAALLAPIAPVEAGSRQAAPTAPVAARISSALAGSTESLVAPGVAWNHGTWATADGAQAVQLVEVVEGLRAGDVEGEFGQLGDGAGDGGQRRLLVAIEHHQAFQHQLAQHPQRRRHVKCA